jgi:hypothetical protein
MSANDYGYVDSDGTYTAGHSGSEASRDRAIADERTGRGKHRREQVLKVVRLSGPGGKTWYEIAGILDIHHGAASGALSNLHKAGRLACLKERRGGAHVYVVPHAVNDRATRPFGRVRAGTSKADAQDQPTPPEPQTADLERRIEDTDTALAAMATEADEQGYGLGRDNGWQRGYDEGVEAAQKRPGALLEAKHLGHLEGRKQQAARTMALISNMRAQLKGKGPVEVHTMDCWKRHGLCLLNAIAKAQVIP